MHSLLFNSVGKKAETKKHIRAFSGFAASVKDDKLKKLLENKKKWTVSLLKEALHLFALPVGGTREELASRLIDYLQSPTITKEGGATPKKSSSSSAKTTTTGKKRKAKTDKSGKPKKKRAPSAYILFTSSIRDELKAKYPEAGATDLMKLLAAEWGALDEEDKAVSLLTTYMYCTIYLYTIICTYLCYIYDNLTPTLCHSHGTPKLQRRRKLLHTSKRRPPLPRRKKRRTRERRKKGQRMILKPLRVTRRKLLYKYTRQYIIEDGDGG